ncbi:hypothetical protein [Streptomyces sp. NPDC057686]|uniref:hypothetical protein n=1 Tax=Streptomyces sp. NPDC057686 TaxID=3346212 RepID=UPI0036A49A4E
MTEQAVVTEWIRTSDPMGGVYDQVTATDLKLPGGGRTRLELMGAHAPAVGTAVQVTRDPQGDAPIRLGPRPGAPGGVLAAIALVVVGPERPVGGAETTGGSVSVTPPHGLDHLPELVEWAGVTALEARSSVADSVCSSTWGRHRGASAHRSRSGPGRAHVTIPTAR